MRKLKGKIFRVHAGDVVLSNIDMRNGVIVLSPPEKGGGTQFPHAPAPPEHHATGDAVFSSAREPHVEGKAAKSCCDTLSPCFSEKQAFAALPCAAEAGREIVAIERAAHALVRRAEERAR